MSDPWFSNVGANGKILLHYDEDGWIATTAETDKEVRCILQDEMNLSPKNGPYRVSGTVSKYIIGTNDDTDYLHFDPDEDEIIQTDPIPQDGEANDSDTSSKPSLDIQGQTNYPYRELSDIDGSGDNVSIVARVEQIYWVKKDESGIPDLKGRLTDESISHGVAFVIGEDVSHPYLDEEMWFLFDNVTDYYWEPQDQTTIWISDETEFTKLQPVSSSSSKSSSSSTSSSSQIEEKSDLSAIAADTIGGMTFTISQEDRESAVGKAKQRARKQQRDPAIDPRFQRDDNTEE